MTSTTYLCTRKLADICLVLGNKHDGAPVTLCSEGAGVRCTGFKHPEVMLDVFVSGKITEQVPSGCKQMLCKNGRRVRRFKKGQYARMQKSDRSYVAIDTIQRLITTSRPQNMQPDETRMEGTCYNGTLLVEHLAFQYSQLRLWKAVAGAPEQLYLAQI